MGLLTQYAGTNGKEAVAEAFAAWMLAREARASHYPELAKAVQDMIEQATQAATKGEKR
ncbi:hypothetical protein [Aeromonas sp. CA23]|uniref:hypothetical protein n=1 Tax=Aeromonas sp. CA23 TaxID=2033032 RepID=UPI0020A31ED2|nr:hypothetical protein [Aeromonas sp. CA23]